MQDNQYGTVIPSHTLLYCLTNFLPDQKFICGDLGRHVAHFHLDLAQLWRCPVTWCTVWRGTPQNCVDHMRRSHMVPASIRAANLARWFPPWTVSRANWNIALRSSVSGVSMDALLFSRVGAQLMHRYCVFARSGIHAAFQGTYMARLIHRTFLNVSDAAYHRSQDKRRGRSLASRMHTKVPGRSSSRELTQSSQPRTSRRPSPASASVAAVTSVSSTPAVISPSGNGSRAASVPLDLS